MSASDDVHRLHRQIILHSHAVVARVLQPRRKLAPILIGELMAIATRPRRIPVQQDLVCELVKPEDAGQTFVVLKDQLHVVQ